MNDNENYQWVHEKDYGAPAVGGIVIGAVQLIVGIVQFVVYLFRGER